jgi:RNA polymerase sigma-70 factor (ECF subfamily)
VPSFAVTLRAAKAGDGQAVGALFRDVDPALRRFLRATEPRAAEDVAGETWLAVARGLAHFDGGAEDFRAWVFAIARRRLADHRRRAARRKTEPADATTFVNVVATEDPESVVVERLGGDEAARLIATTLPPEQAEVVLLRVLAGFDVDEVATIVGRPANWVRVACHRGLRRLAERVGTKIAVTRQAGRTI